MCINIFFNYICHTVYVTVLCSCLGVGKGNKNETESAEISARKRAV